MKTEILMRNYLVATVPSDAPPVGKRTLEALLFLCAEIDALKATATVAECSDAPVSDPYEIFRAAQLQYAAENGDTVTCDKGRSDDVVAGVRAVFEAGRAAERAAIKPPDTDALSDDVLGRECANAYWGFLARCSSNKWSIMSFDERRPWVAVGKRLYELIRTARCVDTAGGNSAVSKEPNL